MKVYLAAPYATRDAIQEHIVPMLEESGHEVTSRWLQSEHPITPGTVNEAKDQSDAYTQGHALEDFEDIDRAEVLVLFTSGWCLKEFFWLRWTQTVSGGRHIETGYALAKGKLVIVVGPPENVFHRGVCVTADGVEPVLSVLNAAAAADLLDEMDDHRLGA